MRIRIEEVADMAEDEMVVRCHKATPEIESLARKIGLLEKQVGDDGDLNKKRNTAAGAMTPEFFKGEQQYFLSFSEILFFETEDENVKYIRSDNFKGANIHAKFGAAKVYFEGCTVSPEGATIHLDVNFAGVEIYLPRSWNIDNQIRAFFGAADGVSSSSGEGPKVTLTGEINFGGVEIKYI
jgi:hypothetical protein